MKYISRFLKGLLVGCVNIIPGVSAGTIAVVTNVYDEIITALSLDFKFIKKNFFRLLALGLGVIAGIFLFSKVIKYLFNNYYRSTMNFFVGLVLGSIPLLVKRARSLPEDGKRWVKWLVAALCFGLVLAYSLLISPKDSSIAITTLSVAQFFRILATLALCSVAMILPGLSGSLMMMFFGVYNTIITAIADVNLLILLPIVLGTIIGVVLGSFILKWLLSHFGKTTNYSIVALVISSLLGVYVAYVIPKMAFDLMLIADIFALIVGVMAGYLLCYVSQKQKINEQKTLPPSEVIELPYNDENGTGNNA